MTSRMKDFVTDPAADESPWFKMVSILVLIAIGIMICAFIYINFSDTTAKFAVGDKATFVVIHHAIQNYESNVATIVRVTKTDAWRRGLRYQYVVHYRGRDGNIYEEKFSQGELKPIDKGQQYGRKMIQEKDKETE